jgi:hypothetical protein
MARYYTGKTWGTPLTLYPQNPYPVTMSKVIETKADLNKQLLDVRTQHSILWKRFQQNTLRPEELRSHVAALNDLEQQFHGLKKKFNRKARKALTISKPIRSTR